MYQTSETCSNLALSERAYIGSLLSTERKAADSGLSVDDFTLPLCKRVFAICLEMERQGIGHDMVTVSDRDETLDAVELVNLSQEFVSDAATAQHIENIRDASQRRNLVGVLRDANSKALDWMTPVSETVSKTKTELDSISSKTAQKGSVSGVDATCDFLSDLDKELSTDGIRTGIPTLDKYLYGGFRGDVLVIIGARPSVGKSALMSFMMANAVSSGKKALYVSLEMKERKIVGRMVAYKSGVPMARINSHTLTEQDYLNVHDALGLLGNDYRISTTLTTPEAIRKEALRMKADGGLDVIYVDYLQLLHSDRKHNGRTEEVGEISRALKLLAMELDRPVIAACQLSRASVTGGNRPPDLPDLRESGSIEQDADIVLMLHSPKGNDAPDRDLYVRKNRESTLGKISTLFDGSKMRFSEIEKRF